MVDTAASQPASRVRWNPWAALRARGPGTELAFAPLADRAGWWERDAEGDVILLDSELGRRARRVTLAHELVHAERGVGFPVASPATMQLEEERVEREALRRLVPPEELEDFVLRRSEVGPVEAADVAEEFDVTLRAAVLACRLLQRAGQGAAADRGVPGSDC